MASITQKVKEGVKETLVGVEGEEQQFSAQTRAEFMQYAIKDDESEEYYMGREEFVNAIAPPSEDYVSSNPVCYFCTALHTHVRAGGTAWTRHGARGSGFF